MSCWVMCATLASTCYCSESCAVMVIAGSSPPGRRTLSRGVLVPNVHRLYQDFHPKGLYGLCSPSAYRV
eukprot:12887838-Prorocentrum_lima.AAC.1